MRTTLGAALALAAAALCATPAAAGLDVYLGGQVDVGNDASIYFGVSSRYFHREPAYVEDWSRRMRDPDDVAVLLYLAQRSRRDPAAIFMLRERGLSWFEIGVQIGVPRDVWFVPVKTDPGPPYGKAYGHWRKHGKSGAYRLGDDDCRNLVAVRVLHEYYGMPVERAMAARANGTSLPRLVGTTYRERHGSKHGSPKATRASGPGDDRGSSGKLGKSPKNGKPAKNGKPGKH